MRLKPSQIKSRWSRTAAQKRPPEKCAEGFLAWLRKLPCFIAGKKGHVCSGKVRSAHFDPFGDKGVATKVSDRASLPLCDGAHAEQTDVLGWPKFQEKYGFEGRAACDAYWKSWPGLRAWLQELAGAR